MKTKLVWAVLFAGVGLCAAAVRPVVAEQKEERKAGQESKGIALDTRKIEESDAKSKPEDPHFGYVGLLGTFEATAKSDSGHGPFATFVVHQYPDQHKKALGRTKLKFQGAKRLGNVDGWIFQTEWDGKEYPSKVFVSAERVYFGGGVVAYIVADYRNESGWAWKYFPMRRMELLKKSERSTERR